MISHPEMISTIAAQADRLDRYLAQTHSDISRARFQRLIAEGHVKVEGAVVVDPGFRLKTGQAVEFAMPPPVDAEPAAEHMALDVVYEDRHVIVINKPAGLVVHPAAGHAGGTLVNALLAHCGDSLSGIGGTKRPGIVHRLDKDTSGLLVVAKNDAAHQSLSEQFQAHGRDGRLQRAYLAFVWGQPERATGTISTGIERSTNNRQKMTVSNRPTAKWAVTHYATQERYAGVASLVRCELETGRTHQIRVHMAHIGHPLLGDTTYGSGFKASATKLSAAAQDCLKALKGQALHATLLGFEHPHSGKALQFEAPLPYDLLQLKNALGSQLLDPKQMTRT